MAAQLAPQHDLSVYDAAYLDLALLRSLPLATTHKALTKAARTAGVALAL
jgi:predicted nucleic acid-binding protein